MDVTPRKTNMEPENHPVEEDIDASSMFGCIFFRQYILLGTNTRDPIWRAYFSNEYILAGILTESSPFLRCCWPENHVFFYNMGLLFISPQICRYGRAKIPLHSAQQVD